MNGSGPKTTYMLERGEIVQRTYEDYVTSCKHIVGTFGASTPVASLTSKHFDSLRDSFTGVSPHTITNRVTRAKVAFNWLFDEEYIEKQIRVGSAFRKWSWCGVCDFNLSYRRLIAVLIHE